VTISVAKFDIDYSDRETDETFAVASIATLDGGGAIGFSTTYYPYFDYDPLAGDAPVYGLSTTAFGSQNSTENPIRHALGIVITPASGSGGTSGGDGGSGGFGWPPNTQVP
jgi:hypothetical protein